MECKLNYEMRKNQQQKLFIKNYHPKVLQDKEWNEKKIGYDVQELLTTLNDLSGIRVGDLILSDLMLTSSNCHGIYAFYEGEQYKLHDANTTQNGATPKCWYVGKTSSVALIGRIASHFTPRCTDYSNSLIKHIAYSLASEKDRQLIWDKSLSSNRDRWMKADSFITKAFPVIQDLKIKVIIIENVYDDDTRKCIGILEKALINELRPAFNYLKRFGNREYNICNNLIQKIY